MPIDALICDLMPSARGFYGTTFGGLANSQHFISGHFILSYQEDNSKLQLFSRENKEKVCTGEGYVLVPLRLARRYSTHYALDSRRVLAMPPPTWKCGGTGSKESCLCTAGGGTVYDKFWPACCFLLQDVARQWRDNPRHESFLWSAGWIRIGTCITIPRPPFLLARHGVLDHRPV